MNNKYDDLVEEVRRIAKENLRGIISEEQNGYNGYLKAEMRKIFEERGIEWEDKLDGVSVD